MRIADRAVAGQSKNILPQRAPAWHAAASLLQAGKGRKDNFIYLGRTHIFLVLYRSPDTRGRSAATSIYITQLHRLFLF